MQKQHKNLIWHIQGGLGKNIAATALIGYIEKIEFFVKEIRKHIIRKY